MHALVNIYKINNNGVLAILISGPRSEKHIYLLHPQREYFLLKLSYDGDPMLSRPRIKYLLHASRIRGWPHLILRHANFITNKTGEKFRVYTHRRLYRNKIGSCMCFFFSYFILFSFFFQTKLVGIRGMYWEFVLKQTPKNVVAFWVCENRKSLRTGDGLKL